MNKDPKRLREAWMALAGLSAVFLFEMLDNSILTVALPTIGRQLNTSTAALQWVTGSYSLVFGGLMLALGALADRFGRRRTMLIGLLMLGAASLATVFVTTVWQLIAVRAAMGVAAAMTTPLSIALAFRLFEDDGLRVRAMTLISTVGLVGLAVGPTVGGLVLAVAPWQMLLLVNFPIALLAFVGIRFGIPADRSADLHHDPIDFAGAFLGTATVVLALAAPTFFVDAGPRSWVPWAASASALGAGVLFVLRERSARFPLLDLHLVAHPRVSGGLAFKAATGLAFAGLGYMTSLQLQLDWGWSPAAAAVGMLPQVIVLLAAGPFVNRFVDRVGLDRAAWFSSLAVVLGLAVYATLGGLGYGWIALSLALVAASIRVVGAVAGVNVLRGLPQNRTSLGAALVDTASQVSAGVGIAVSGTLLAAFFSGSIASTPWNPQQTLEFREAIVAAGLALSVAAGVLVVWGGRRARRAQREGAPDSRADQPLS